ncbi:hypothetical protein Mapa_013186 [Marchantia paleacea]|nr:hypothetical protein Mapa_013186 [Marchantia paleacea]
MPKNVQPSDDSGDETSNDFHDPAVDEAGSHLGSRAREVNQGNDSERQSQRQKHLAHNQKLSSSRVAPHGSNDGGRNDSNASSDGPSDPRLDPDLQKPLHHNLARQGTDDGRILPTGQQTNSEQNLSSLTSQRRSQQLVSIGNISYISVGIGTVVKGSRCQNENRRIHKKGEHQRNAGVPSSILDGHLLALLGPWVRPGLNNAGVQKEAVRHDSGSQNSNRSVQHVGILENYWIRNQPLGHLGPFGLDHRQLVSEDACYQERHAAHDELQKPEAFDSEDEDEQCVHGRDEYPGPDWDFEQKVESCCGADHLGKISGSYGNLDDYPEEVDDILGVCISARLSQVSLGHHSELERQRLEEDGAQVREQNDGKKSVAILGTSFQVRGPVAGIHVRDADHESEPDESQHLLVPWGSGLRPLHGRVNLHERWCEICLPPASGQKRLPLRHLQCVSAQLPSASCSRFQSHHLSRRRIHLPALFTRMRSRRRAISPPPSFPSRSASHGHHGNFCCNFCWRSLPSLLDRDDDEQIYHSLCGKRSQEQRDRPVGRRAHCVYHSSDRQEDIDSDRELGDRRLRVGTTSSQWDASMLGGNEGRRDGRWLDTLISCLLSAGRQGLYRGPIPTERCSLGRELYCGSHCVLPR